LQDFYPVNPANPEILSKNSVETLTLKGVLWTPAERTHSSFHHPQAPSNTAIPGDPHETVPEV
jgi:hypothetical protein